MQNLKDSWKKLSGKTKKIIVAIVMGTVLIAGIGIFALNLNDKTEYSTLFTELNREEAQDVAGLLQEEGIDYKYNSGNGTIRVPEPLEDTIRAKLLSQGYPKSGFTYDIYRNNAGLMTTESDKKQYTLYDLQDRLGAQICLFDGVRDAKVTIAEAEEQKYALADNQTDASASVVVTMKDGQSLNTEKAGAIRNLISRSVNGLNFTNVSVFDAATMMEVSGSGDDSSKDMANLANMLESNIAINIRRVLEMLYGQGNVAVSVKGSLNMEKLIQEYTRYSTPEKIDEIDKSGLLQKENATYGSSSDVGQNAGGAVGTDANADPPRYTNNSGAQGQTSAYADSSTAREWLYDTLKEQRQVEPGVLENISVGIVVITDDNSIPVNELRSLVANSAGISQATASDNITIVRSAAPVELHTEADPPITSAEEKSLPIPLPAIIAIGAGSVLVSLILALLLTGRKKKRAKQAESFEDETTITVDTSEQFDQEAESDEDMFNLGMQNSIKLKENIGNFVEQNPQVAAKLVQSWLGGKGGNDGGKQS